MSEQYTVTGLDFWDYRHPSSIRFNTQQEAEAHAERLNRINPDPLYCYFIEKVPAQGAEPQSADYPAN